MTSLANVPRALGGAEDDGDPTTQRVKIDVDIYSIDDEAGGSLHDGIKNHKGNNPCHWCDVEVGRRHGARTVVL